MTSKSSAAPALDDELEDGEIEDDLEEFNEYESLFQTSEASTVVSRQKPKAKRNHNSRRGRDNKSSDRSRSHSTRTSHRQERSKSPSTSKSHGGVSSRRRTSPLSSKRSHSSGRRRTSSSDVVAKGLRQKAESRLLRRRKRGDSPPKTTMRYLLHQRYPTRLPASQSRKKRTSSDTEEYEQLLLKHREVQEAIEQAKSDVQNRKSEVRGHKQKSRSRSRSGSQTDILEQLEQPNRKENAAEISELTIDEDDDEMDELQLRMIALKSATRAVVAREEKENQIEQLKEKVNQKAVPSSPSSKLSRSARQEERKQKLAKWKKQHSLTVEINKVTDEKSRYELFMDHVSRAPDAGRKTTQQNLKPNAAIQLIASTQLGDDSDSDIQEIPVTPPGTEVKETTFQSDNYEAVEMELDTEESSFTPPIPGVSDGPDIELLLMNQIEKTQPHTTRSAQPPPPGVSRETSIEENQTETKPPSDEAKGEGKGDEEEDDEEEMLALRQLLLQSVVSKRAAKKQQEKEYAEMKVGNSQPPASQPDETTRLQASKSQGSPQVSSSSGAASPTITSALKQLRQAATAKSKPSQKPKIPVHKPVIIQPGDDSDSSDDERNTGRQNTQSLAGLSGIDLFLKEARKTADKAKTTTSSDESHSQEPNNKPTTPEAMSKLPDSHRAEYQRLKQEIVRREQQKQSSSRPGSGTASPDPSVAGVLARTLQVTVKSGSKSATASPDRSEVRLVTVNGEKQAQSKTQGVQNKERDIYLPTSGVTKSDSEDGSASEQQRREVLLREQAQKREIRACKEKMLKHRQAIQKGHKLLHSLNIQVDRKCKLVNLMQGRVNKLQEDLLSAQKMVSLHQDQVTKFEDQKQQVRNRLEKHVLEEKQLRKKLALAKGVSVSEISQPAASSQTNANATNSVIGSKRPLEPNGSVSLANKKSKMQGATLSPAKQKPKSDTKLQELQRLERAYAQKIEQLREAQAKKTQVKMALLSPAASRLMRNRKSTPNVKPSKQVYSIDKIALGSNGNSSGDEGPARYKRRKSWLDGQNPTVKPNLFESGKVTISQKLAVSQKLKQPASPVMTRHGAKRTSSVLLDKHASTSKESRKQEKMGKMPPEPIVEGLYMPSTQQLKLLQQIQAEKSQRGIDFLALAQSFDAFQRHFVKEDGAEGFELKTALQKEQDGNMEEDEKADSPLTMYTSPLIPFKAYRLCPHFEAGSHMARHSSTVSNKIHPMRPFCKFELNGKCNDEECPWQHERDYLLKELDLYEDLSSYTQLRTPTHSSSESKNSDKKEKEFEKMKKLVEKEKNSGRIDVVQRKKDMGNVCVEIVRKHFQNKGISVLLEPRKRPKTYLKSSSRGENPDTYLVPGAPRRQPISKPDSLCLEDTERYFFGTSEGVLDLEAAVLEKPKDIELWLKLAYKQLADDSGDKSIDKALYALCRGLESNKNNSDLWLHYLTLYEARDKHPDLLQLCQQAVEFAPHYEIWWKYITLKPSFSEKDAECEKLLEFVKEQQKNEKTAVGSHRLLETLLYRVQLHITSRRINQGLSIFQDALREYSITSLSRHLFPEDRCLAWLAYLHVMGFHCLPPSLFNPATGALGRLVSKEPFMFPWQHADPSRLSESLIAGFQDALLSCSSSQLPIEDSIEICLPIYHNLFTMEAKLDRLNKAQSVCRHLLHDCPTSSQLWLCLIDIEKKNNSSEENIAKVFKEALSGCPTSAELHYCAAKFELEHDNKDEAIQYLKQCVIRYFDLETNSTELNTHDVVNLYRTLLHQHLPYDYKPPAAGITSEVVQRNLLHLWSCYCLYLEKLQGHIAACAAYETGLCALKTAKDVQKLWIQYLEYQKSQVTSNGENDTVSWKIFTDLVNRCLISTATVWPLPHSSTDTWLDFSFHNRVLELYFGCMRREDAGDAFELYLNRMPENLSLAYRACQHYIEGGSEFQAQLIARTILSDHPTCVPFWKIAISLCVKNGQTKEAHQMYQRAVEVCPLSASLWKDYLLFEVTRGKGRDELKKLILRCRDDIGLNMNDYLATIFKT